MSKIAKLLSLMVTISILACCYTSVNAMSVITSNISVNAGANGYSSQYCIQTSTQTQCYIRLDSFQFSGYSAGYMPTGKTISARLYMIGDDGNLYSASGIASFPSTGSKTVNFSSGYGGAGQAFRLKTNSTFNCAYSATFKWKSEPN